MIIASIKHPTVTAITVSVVVMKGNGMNILTRPQIGIVSTSINISNLIIIFNILFSYFCLGLVWG